VTAGAKNKPQKSQSF